MSGRRNIRPTGDEGFTLVGAIVLVFLVLLALSVAAPRVAMQLKRERELETERRGDQYVRAIRKFYMKNGSHYPGSVDQLEKTNNQRFLRQRYLDPLTGQDDWRLIHLGENKTTVKGFFGEDLPGIAGGLGAAAGMSSGIGTSSTTGSSGSSTGGTSIGGASSFGGNTGGLGSGAGSLGGSGTSSLGSSSGTGTTGTGSGAAGGSTGSGSGSGLPSGGGPIIGVGTGKSGDAILVVNEQTTYDTWEFLYDPRWEQFRAKANILGGVAAGSGLGTSIGTPIGGTQPGNGTNNPTNGTPQTPTAPR